MIFKILDLSEMKEYHAEAEYLSGDGRFGNGVYCEISVVNSTVLTSLETENDDIITSYKLYNNIPNPFNPETTIKYELPKTSHVSLKIYNILGQEVKTLINDKKSAGIHQIKWDGTNNNGIKVNSGIYLYRLQTGDFVKTKKMILLK